MLDLLDALGPFFAVSVHPPHAVAAEPWRSLGDLAEPGKHLQRRMSEVRAALAARTSHQPEFVDEKVAVSALHFGLVARLLAPALAVAAAGQRLDMQLHNTWWLDDTSSGPACLSVCELAVAPASTGPGSGLEARQLIDEVIAPITAAALALAKVSPRVLWGNVASAVNGAAQHVSVHRVDLGSAAQATATALLGHPLLSYERQPPGPAFRRSSCCLIYRLALPESARNHVCGDCILAPL